MGLKVHLPESPSSVFDGLDKPIGALLTLIALLVFTLLVVTLGGCDAVTPQTAAKIADCGARYQACWIQTDSMDAYVKCRAIVDKDCLGEEGGGGK